MAQAQTHQNQTNNNTSTNGEGNGKQRETKVLTAIEAITKITKILDQLSPSDRKRVLAFVNESNPSPSGE